MADRRDARRDRGVGAISRIILVLIAVIYGSLAIGLGWAAAWAVLQSEPSSFGVTMLVASLLWMAAGFVFCLGTIATAFGIGGGRPEVY